MPTIIDSLVVELGLDPKGFTQGQRQAVANLRGLQTQTAQTVGNIQGQLNSLGQFFAKIGAPIAGINTQLNNLGQQSRRTGSAVSAGALQGAAGLSEMASAGLAAYAALKSVQGLLKQIGDASAAGANIGRLAARTGVSTQWLSSFELAAQRMANVNPDVTGNALNEYQQKFTAFSEFGEPNEAFTKLAALGIDLSKPLPEQIAQIADVLHSKNGPAAQYWATQVGLGPLVDVLRQGAPTLQREMNRANSVAVTQQQTESYQKLQSAINGVFQAFDGMVNKFVERHPEIAANIEAFDNWLRTMQSTPEGMQKLESAFRAVSIAIGTMLVGIVGKFIWANTAIMRTPLGLFLLGAYVVNKGLEGDGPHDEQGNAPWVKKAEKNGWFSTLGIFADVYKRFAPEWAGGNPSPAATAAIPPASGGIGGGTAPTGERVDEALKFFMDKGWSREQSAGIVARLHAESGLNPISHNDIAGGHTGIGQWDHSRWSRFLSMYGGDTSYKKQLEYVDWELNNTEAKAGRSIRAQSTAYGAGRAMEEYERAENPSFTHAAAAAAEALVNRMGAIKAAQSAGKPWYSGSGTSNSNSQTDRSVTVGDVHVHVPAGTDGYGVGTATSNALKKIVAQTNTALE